MKKRKTSFILIGILVVAFGSIGAMNIMASQSMSKTDDHGHETPQQPENQPVTSEARGTESAEDLRNDLLAAEEKRQRPKAPLADRAAKPTVLREKAAIDKPTVNDSQTAGQWWSQESEMARRAKEDQ